MRVEPGRVEQEHFVCSFACFDLLGLILCGRRCQISLIRYLQLQLFSHNLKTKNHLAMHKAGAVLIYRVGEIENALNNQRMRIKIARSGVYD